MRNHESFSQQSPETSRAETRSGVPEFAGNAAQQERQQQRFQQDKLATALLNNDLNVFSQRSITPLSETDKAPLYHAINDPAESQVMLSRAADFISHLNTPADQHGINAVFARSSSDFERHFLASALQIPPTDANLAKLNSSHLQTLLQTVPTPFQLEDTIQIYLGQLAEHPDVSQQDLDAYRTGIERFEQKIYGKRYEYAKAYSTLVAEAATHPDLSSMRNAVLEASRPQPQVPTTPPDSVNPSAPQRTEAETDPLNDSLSYWAPERTGQEYQPASTTAPQKKGLFSRLFGKK